MMVARVDTALFLACFASGLKFEDQALAVEHLQIGVIADSHGRSTSQSSFKKYNYNMTTILTNTNMAEVFTVHRSVRMFDADETIDVILLLGYGHTDALHAHRKQLIISNKRKAMHSDTKLGNELIKDKSLQNSCLGNYVKAVSTDDVYCRTAINVSSSTVSSTSTISTFAPKILVQLIQNQLHWKAIFIFHENHTEMEARQLIDNLSLEGVSVVVYNIDDIRDIHAVFSHIYETSVYLRPEINIGVICSMECTSRLLNTANDFDSQKKLLERPTLLSQFSRWLVLVYGYANEVFHSLHACADDLDNVVIIPIPDVVGPSVQDIPDILERLATEINLEAYTDKSSHQPTKEYIVQKLAELVLTWTPSSRCNGYYIDTLLWTDSGRGFSTVGYADITGNVVLRSDLFPNTRYGYNKRKFIVSTKEWFPFVMNTTSSITNEDGEVIGTTVRYDGLTMEMLEELSIVLNFTYELVGPPDDKWGGLVIKDNLTFNGLIGHVQRKECDFVAAPMSIQPHRDPVVDFSYPYYLEYTTVIVKKPDPEAMKWRTLIDPFRWEILLVIGISLAVVSVLIFLLEKYNPFYDNPRCNEDNPLKGDLHSLPNSLWCMYGALVTQGCMRSPDSVAGRTFISSWWLVCTVVVGIYSGNLIAFLTVTKEKAPFHTLEDMVETDGLKWGTLDSTSWSTAFFTSSLPTYTKIGDGLREFNKTDQGVLDQSLDYHLNRVKQGGYAWIGDKTAIEIATSTECALTKIKDEFLPLNYALIFPDKSPHTAIFSEQIIKLHESGLLQIWKRKWWPKSNFCALGGTPVGKAISLQDVQSAFYVCCIGVFVGLVSFISEQLVYRVRVLRKRDSKKPGTVSLSN